MASTLEKIIGFHCAPVLRGIKVANLVAIPRELNDEFAQAVQLYNKEFNYKGLYFFELCHCPQKRLLLVFRKEMLQNYLLKSENVEFLAHYGYDVKESLIDWLYRLKMRLEACKDFPHEIGMFLGYPLADIKGFITYCGSGYLLCGEWKVYSNRISAMQSFYCYKLCRKFCQTELEAGKGLADLVA